METIDYSISLYPSKFVAKHKTIAKNQPNPEIIIYLSHLSNSIEEYIQENWSEAHELKEPLFFHYFASDFVFLTLLERVCLECRLNNKTRVERGLGKKRIRGRCNVYKKFTCKMEYIADKILNLI